MNINSLGEENIFYAQIIHGKLNVEKLIVAVDNKDLINVVNDFQENYDYFISLSLKKINDLLKPINENKELALVYKIKNMEDEFKVSEEIKYVDDLNALIEENKEKETFILGKDFLLSIHQKIKQSLILDNVIYSDKIEGV